MGPSGAGKSSLLNAISGYCTSGVSGHLKIDRKNSCYITQEDHHQTLLSVEELMHLSCDLKLKHDCRKNKKQLIEEILVNLNLNHRRTVKANKLSGGERKRLSVALELVANPKIFFLDEPTSGLDEVTALQCVRLLSNLAKQGHTVVCTIHQPSASVFNYFDNVYVLAQGKCVYQGPPLGLVPFLGHAQKECPKHYSPSDYIIELCDFEGLTAINYLAVLTDNGKLIFTPPVDTIKSGTIEGVTNPLPEPQSFIFRHAVTTFFPEINQTPGLTSILTKSHNSFYAGTSLLFDHMKTFSKSLSKSHDGTSGFQQFCVLSRVMFLRILRARIPILIQFIHHTMVGLFFGMLFYNLGNQGSHMFAHLKFCISAILMIAYTQVTIPVLTFPLEVKIVKKETFNHWYSLTPYYMALSISRLPLQIVYNVIYLTIIYWMTGFPPQWWRFAIFISVGLMTSFVAEGLGLSIGATFSITNGSVVGPMIIASFIGLAIYGFDFAPQIPELMNFSMKTSFMRNGVVALILTLFGYGRETLDCNEIYCHFSDPRVLLRFLDLENVTLQQQFMYLFVLLVLFRSLLYISLRIQCKT
ncbi:ATP-binding cassette subfamily G member 4-like [Calliphora vicina]